jgi:hypothetical protein
MAILYDWYENPGESDDSEEKGLHPRIFLNGRWERINCAV